MDRYSVKDLAAALSKKKGLSIDEAENFVSSFFSLINDGILTDKMVKIKGFGTFKLVDVQDRESVDVNTGDRMLISGHSKVSFQPDAALRDMVNKPFSHFETVVINDNVDFDKINVEDFPEEFFSEDSEHMSSVDTNSNQIRISVPDIRDLNNSDSAHEVWQPISGIKDTIDSDETHSEASGITIFETKVAGPDKTQDSLPMIEETEGGSLVVTEMSENPKSDESECSIPADGNESEIVCEIDDSQSIADSIESDNSVKKNRTWGGVKYFIAVIVCVLIFIGGYLIGRIDFSTIQSNGKTQVSVKPDKKQIVKQVSQDKSSAKKVDKEETKEKTDEPVPTTVEKDSIAANDDMKSAMRIAKYGAYDIIGTDKEVKVKVGQSVKDLARIYLGEGMECYIQIHNNRMTVSSGETVKIPKLRLKKRQRSSRDS